MFFPWLSSVTILAIYGTGVAAVPAPSGSSSAAAPAPTASQAATNAAVVWMCKGTDAAGPCQAQAFELNKCGQFSNGYSGHMGGAQDISALSGTSPIKCLWYLTEDCSGDSYDNQDDENLTDGNGDFAGMKSVMCKPDS